jgi:hypothetical protein
MHEPVEPTTENGWASWYCPDCEHECASDNPCNCCLDDEWAALAS